MVCRLKTVVEQDSVESLNENMQITFGTGRHSLSSPDLAEILLPTPGILQKLTSCLIETVQATPLQLAWRYIYPSNQNIWRFWAQPHVPLLRRPPVPLLPHMNQPQYIRPWHLRPEVYYYYYYYLFVCLFVCLFIVCLLSFCYHILWWTKIINGKTNRDTRSVRADAR